MIVIWCLSHLCNDYEPRRVPMNQPIHIRWISVKMQKFPTNYNTKLNKINAGSNERTNEWMNASRVKKKSWRRNFCLSSIVIQSMFRKRKKNIELQSCFETVSDLFFPFSRFDLIFIFLVQGKSLTTATVLEFWRAEMAFRVAKSKNEDYFQVNYFQLTLKINTFTYIPTHIHTKQ